MTPVELTQIALGLALAWLFFMLALLRRPHPLKHTPQTLPAVTLIIPFRNEQPVIAPCVDAVKKLNYPVDRLQVLWLNDRSEDNSRAIVAEAIANEEHMALRDISEDRDNLKAKMNVLAQGMEMATGEFIFITDADCRPHHDWLRTLLSYFDENTAMVCGSTVLEALKEGESKRFFAKLQAWDWVYLQGLAVSASNAGKTVTVVGNNLAFRKSAYQELGGYKQIGFSLTEDHALMQAILDNGVGEVKYICDPEGPVFSLEMSGWLSFVRQRLRWIKGGMKGRPFAFVLVGGNILVHLLVPALFVLGEWSQAAAAAIGLILGLDYLIFSRYLKLLNLPKSGFFNFLLYWIFYMLYSIVLLLLLPLPKKVRWKGRTY